MSDTEQRITGYEPGGGDAAADEALQAIDAALEGPLTNDQKVLANSAATIQSLEVMRRLMHGAKLSAIDREIVAVGIARRTRSAYYLTACAKLLRWAGVAHEDVVAALEGRPMSDPRHALIQEATQKLCDEQGRLSDEEMARYRAWGLSETELIEIITMIGWYLIATYTNNLARTEIDAFWLAE